MESAIVKEWTAYGMPCLVREIKSWDGTSHYCGYVGVEEDHPTYEKRADFEAFDGIDVHGGVTFAGYILRDRGYFVGFDCNHAGDCRNGEEPKLSPFFGYQRVWTVEDVKVETEHLAKQLSVM